MGTGRAAKIRCGRRRRVGYSESTLLTMYEYVMYGSTMRLLLTFEYPFHAMGYGGGHQITRGLARALARQGHEVHVACTGVDELGVAAADSGVQYHFGGSFS